VKIKGVKFLTVLLFFLVLAGFSPIFAEQPLIMSLSSDSSELCVGENQLVLLTINRNGKLVDIAEFFLEFDSKIIEVESVEFDELFKNGRWKINKDGEKSALVLTGLKLSKEAPGEKFTFAEINLKGKAAGKTTLLLKSGEFSAVGQSETTGKMVDSSLNFTVNDCNGSQDQTQAQTPKKKDSMGWLAAIIKWLRSLIQPK
jgi:hypothetical protein